MTATYPLQIKSRHGYTLAAELSIPKGEGQFPLVMFAHGYRTSKNSKKIACIAKKFKEKYACCRFDFSGHGESGGEFESLTITRCSEDIEDILAHIRQTPEAWSKKIDTTRVILYGSSLGGCVSVIVASRHPEVKAMLLFAPASDYTHRLELCRQARKKGNHSISIPFRGIGTLQIHCTLIEDGAAYDFYGLAKKIACPVLIFHGDNDDVVPLEHSKRLEQSFPHARLEILHGVDHTFNDDPELIEKLAGKCLAFLVKSSFSN